MEVDFTEKLESLQKLVLYNVSTYFKVFIQNKRQGGSITIVKYEARAGQVSQHWNSFTTNLSLLDQNCIQIQSWTVDRVEFGHLV